MRVRLWRLLAAATVAGLATALVGAALDKDSPVVSRAALASGPKSAAAVSRMSDRGAALSSANKSVACGIGGATSTIAAVDRTAAQRIYNGELRSSEVTADLAHVEASKELLNALATSNEAAAYNAVHALVYTPHWHIVRLRVVKNGHVLADVGGPYVIAPVSGTLRFKGKVVGSFIMSVQDDLGFLKLVTRFTGIPIDLYEHGALVMGTLQAAPSPAAVSQAVVVMGQTTEHPSSTHSPSPPARLRPHCSCLPQPAGSQRGVVPQSA